MRYTLFLLITLLSFIPHAIAQPEVSLSEPFQEANDGSYKVLQLPNGNTALCIIDKKSVTINIYDKAHKLTTRKTTTAAAMGLAEIGRTSGSYCMGNEVVFFTPRMIKKQLVMDRIRFNCEDGSLVESKKIVTIQSFSWNELTMPNDQVVSEPLRVEKDLYSNAYAVISFQRFPDDINNRIRVYHFSGKHELISEAPYGTLGNLDYLNCMGIVVDEKRVIVACYGGSNTSKNSKMIISRLRSGETEFSHQVQDVEINLKKSRGIMCYNPGTNRVQLLTSSMVDSKGKFFSNTITNYYALLMSYIDPENLEVVKAFPVEFKKIKIAINNPSANDEPFHGLPHNMIINDDFTTTITAEEMGKKPTSSGREYSFESTDIKNAAVDYIDTSGIELSGISVFKPQAVAVTIPTFNQHYRVKGDQFVSAGFYKFFSFDYFQTSNGKYMLFNDYRENHDNKIPKKLQVVQQQNKSDAVIFILGKDLKNYFAFGEPNEDTHTFINLESSDFQRSNDTYAAVTIKLTGKERHAHVAWLTFK